MSTCVGLWLLSATVVPAAGLNMTVSSSNSHAWGENIGWINFSPAHGGVRLVYNGSDSYLEGYAWCQNIGWIKLGADGAGGPYRNTAATNWGVNMDERWNLSGFGWSEAAGWLNFAPAGGGVRVEPTSGKFTGYAWGQNVGWIKFGSAPSGYGLEVVIEVATNDVPYWWFWNYGWTNQFDEAALADHDGDGMLNWEEYVAGTIPTDADSCLGLRRLAGGTSTGGSLVNVEWHSVSDKIYTVERATNLLESGAFVVVATGLQAQGGVTLFVDTNAFGAPAYFYRVKVQR